VKKRSWASSKSPPILHRKETFLSPSHPRYDEYAELTRQEAELGLLSRHTIGTRRKWEELLAQEGVAIDGHEVRTASVPLTERIRALLPKIVEEAQKVLDDWEQDEEGWSEDYGTGGVCHIITEEAFQSVLADAGIDSTSISSSFEVHVYAIAFDTDTKEAALVDIRPWCYETGAGYTWKKIPEVVLESDDVVIEDHDYDDVMAYLEEEGGW
jgi:hypothetical protein